MTTDRPPFARVIFSEPLDGSAIPDGLYVVRVALREFVDMLRAGHGPPQLREFVVNVPVRFDPETGREEPLTLDETIKHQRDRLIPLEP